MDTKIRYIANKGTPQEATHLFTLDELLLGDGRLVGLGGLIRNEMQSRFDGLLHVENGIAYNPTVSIKRVDRPGLFAGLPYGLYINNPSRSMRPKPTQGTSSSDAPKKPCAFCTNHLGKELEIMRDTFEAYALTPNKFHIVGYHMLLMSRECRKQNDLLSEDLEAAMKFSYLFDMFMIYNRMEAGGTIDHFHMQAFPYELAPGHTIPLHAVLEGQRENDVLLPYCERLDVPRFSLKEYPGATACFAGSKAPQQTLEYLAKSRSEAAKYNLVVDKDVIVVVPRNNIYAPNTGTFLAGLEMCGGIPTLNIVDKHGNVVTSADQLQESQTYYIFQATMQHATCAR